MATNLKHACRALAVVLATVAVGAQAARIETVTIIWNSSNTAEWQLANSYGYWSNTPGRGIYHNTAAGNTANRPPYDYANQMVLGWEAGTARDQVLLRFPVEAAIQAALGDLMPYYRGVTNATLSLNTWWHWGAQTFHVSEVLRNWDDSLAWGTALHTGIRGETPGAPRLYTGTHPGSGPNYAVLADVTSTFATRSLTDIANQGWTVWAPGQLLMSNPSGSPITLTMQVMVPEPTSFVLLGLGGLALLKRRR